jgi:dihydrofolate reductase
VSATPKLIYSAIASLDGYIEDARGNFDWARPDEEVHAFVNDLQRPIGTYLYGRRLYETMAFWEQLPEPDAQPPVMHDFAAIWQGADKVVYSRTLPGATTARTRLEREFDPAAVARLKAAASADMAIGGAQLAAHAFAAGLIDECQLFLVPVIVGGGKHAMPTGGPRVNLRLLEQRRFASGTVYVRYRVCA